MDDRWVKSLSFDLEDKNRAYGELHWLHAHSNMREYMLIARIDTLQDEVQI